MRVQFVSTGKYKVLEKLVNTTQLPALVEQKPDDTHRADVFEPLTLTAKVEQTFLVVNCINEGKPSMFMTSDE